MNTAPQPPSRQHPERGDLRTEPPVSWFEAGGRLFSRLEDGIAVLALALIVLLPLIEISGRPLLGRGIAGSIDYVRHLTLWIGLLGAVLAARQGRHLVVGLAAFLGRRWRAAAALISSVAAVAVSFILAWASWELVRAEMASVWLLGGVLPQWFAQVIMPVGFLLIGIHFLRRTPGGVWGGLSAAIASSLALVAVILPVIPPPSLFWPGIGLVVVAALAGAPIFVVLGGLALFLFHADGMRVAIVPAEAYSLASNAVLPSIPLFTLAGTILAEGKAPLRLIRAFRALFGSVPGGTAIAAVVVCAFFTTFTGGSGVAILALGGLLFPVLVGQGYGERFSLGVLTASGGMGILFPPSLVIILYGIAAHTPIDELFVGGIIPGVMLIGMISLYAVWKGWGLSRATTPFDLMECAAALWHAKWELALPGVVLFGILSPYATVVETAALAALYVMVTEGLVHRDLHLWRDFPRLFRECALMVGGIIIILASAMGLTQYLVFNDVHAAAADLAQAGIASKWLFLLALFLFLLVIGCVMDIFSAIVVVVPLIAPVAFSFGVDPVHLGIIFLANMELGYLTPPVGLNLFVASFRFERPVLELYRAVFPFFLIMLLGVLLITLVPPLSTGLLGR
jgi:C4-dicarboxylate transporter, DctM subunit